jgi:magnesium-transporting ATPase (P-type)
VTGQCRSDDAQKPGDDTRKSVPSLVYVLVPILSVFGSTATRLTQVSNLNMVVCTFVVAQHLRSAMVSHCVYLYFQPARMLVHRRKKNLKWQMALLTSALLTLTLALSPRLNTGFPGTGPA